MRERDLQVSEMPDIADLTDSITITIFSAIAFPPSPDKKQIKLAKRIRPLFNGQAIRYKHGAAIGESTSAEICIHTDQAR